MCSIPLYSSGAGRDPYTCMCVKEEEEEEGGRREEGRKEEREEETKREDF